LPDAGYNPPFGLTVFFHIPQDYDGKTSATLQFTDAQGKVIRSIQLHLATEKEKKDKEKAEGAAYGSEVQATEHLENAAEEAADNEKSTDQKIRDKEARLAAVEPGMNRLQWDLRYPYATEITGYHAPIAAGGLEDSVQGPVAVPGTYSVVLDYGGQQTPQNFTVALGPRRPAPQEAPARPTGSGLTSHRGPGALDNGINRARAAGANP